MFFKHVLGSLAALVVTTNPAMANETAAATQITGAIDAANANSASGDREFQELFASWKSMDHTGVITNAPIARVSIPAGMPVQDATLTSDFGMRNHPVLGGRRNHKGVDLAQPTGTPVYATADGVVRRAQWANGYGNLVEINHGNGLETRYGHLSKLIAQPNERVRRGQLIGLMGSTGRSTGSHLHYEVRIAGSAVNPMPYIEGTNYELALAEAKAHSDQQIAMGGPEARKSTDNRDR